ncbi:MAG: radical SAM protein [Proteobacteria bacterium]|nr:radical SAM protein [Pseudomonadota bacterium]
MKVGLVYPSWTKSYGIFGYFARRNSSWPPMNLALIGAIVQQHDHQAFIVDGTLDELSVDDTVTEILSKKPDIVGLTSYSPFFHVQVELATALKKAAPDLPIMIGGAHATIIKEKALLECFDYVFVGEAENTLPEFLNRLENGKDLSSLKGVVWRGDDGKPVFEGPAPATKDFDALPIPDRELVDSNKYFLGTLNGRNPFTLIQTTRGCPWKCIFCASEDLNTTRILRRSPESVVAEMKGVVEKYGIRHFFIVDDVLTLYEEHILKICDLIEEENLKITWEGSTRANLVSDSQVKRMAECGLIRLSFGLETVDTEMRKTMNKKVPLKYYVDANRILNKYNVEAMNSVMIGLPGETEETVRTLLRFLSENRDVKQANLAIAVPYPGTEFHRIAKNGENGMTLHTDDFSQYRRYGSAVTTVGQLSPKDLVELQNEGFVRIYAAPWRWGPMYGKHGVIGFLLMFFRVAQMFRWHASRKLQSVFSGPLRKPAAALAGAPGDNKTQPEFGHQGSPKSPHF